MYSCRLRYDVYVGTSVRQVFLSGEQAESQGDRLHASKSGKRLRERERYLLTRGTRGKNGSPYTLPDRPNQIQFFLYTWCPPSSP